MKLIFLVFCCISGNIFAQDLPLYFSRCFLSDPNLKYCAVAVANIVIPRLVQGDKELGVPVTDPVYYRTAKIGGKNLKIFLTDAYSYDFKKFRLTEACCTTRDRQILKSACAASCSRPCRNYILDRMDLKKNKGGFTAVADFTTSFADYSISDGKVLNRPVFGRGKAMLTLVEPTVRYETDLFFYEKNGEKHVRLDNVTVKLTVNRAYYTFTDLQSSEKGQDLDEFIYENWQILYAETKPSIEHYLTEVIQSITVPILEKVPFTAMFVQ